MQLDGYCIECLIRRQWAIANANGEGEKAYHYLRDVMRILLDAPKDVAAPYVMPLFDDAYAKYWPEAGDRYAQIKTRSNAFMLERLPQMRKIVRESADPLLMALKFTQTGNYIDFGPLADSVCDEELEKRLLKTPENTLDEDAYARFRADLSKARHFLCLGDNAGEIVADRLLVEVLREQYPDLAVTYCVRGGPVLNDATREDAHEAGLDTLCRVIDNGARISGTQLGYISDELRVALDTSDLVLAKGQANFETLFPCQYHVYFLFLCKCARFQKLFNVPMLTGMFLPMDTVQAPNPFC